MSSRPPHGLGPGGRSRTGGPRGEVGPGTAPSRALRPSAEDRSLRPVGAPHPEGDPAICPHCWMVNPGPFRLCARCGASMHTILQESAGLRRTAPVQSPVPVAGARLSLFQRGLMALFVVLMALAYLSHLLPLPRAPQGGGAVPATAEG